MAENAHLCCTMEASVNHYPSEGHKYFKKIHIFILVKTLNSSYFKQKMTGN